MLSLFLILTLQFINKVSASQLQEQCVFTDANTGTVFYLDALQYAKLIHVADAFNDKHTYTYTPCRSAAGLCANSAGSNGWNTGQVIQTLDGAPDICTVISFFDSTVQPTYNSVGNGTWQFVYQNGDDAGCGAPRIFNAFFYCDPTAGDYQVISAGELGISCTYEFNIRSKWACPGIYTTTTSIPIEYCKWNANNGANVLDLSTLDNGTIVAQLESNDNLFYRYSPCRNAQKCNDTMDMIDVYDIVALGCKQYVAIWEMQYHSVSYNSVEKSWQFIYLNGQKCDGYESIMTIIWKCNPRISSYQVIKADTIAPCQNFVEIESNIACT